MALATMNRIRQKLGAKTVEFHGRRDLSEMPAFYALADGMLVTLMADETLSLTLPGKVQTYMAAGKPIIASANGEIEKVVEEATCGYCTAAEDEEGLERSVREFCKDVESGRAKLLGDNAFKYYKWNNTK